jgi:hypothetical protein
MALSISTLTASEAVLLAPTVGLRYGTTSMWIFNSDTVDRIVTLYFRTSGGAIDEPFLEITLGAKETKEFPLERIALEGGSDDISGKADSLGVVKVHISYITL